MNVLLVIAGIAGLTLLLLAIAYCWKNRPYRGDGSDEWRDEMALEADRSVYRSGGGGIERAPVVQCIQFGPRGGVPLIRRLGHVVETSVRPHGQRGGQGRAWFRLQTRSGPIAVKPAASAAARPAPRS